MIELKNATKIYKGKDFSTKAMDNLSLKIDDGEFVAIMGTSGSGKSTLLNILGMMDTLTDGEYYFDSLPIHTQSVKKLEKIRKDNISFVFQNFALMKEYTVYENVEMPLIAKGIGFAARKKIVLESLEKVGILDLKNKLPKNISGGQQQRCAIARAIATDNKYLLADEPTGALDKHTTFELMDLLKKINESKKTIILVTHDKDVANYASRIINIEDGKIIP